jgi:hypothetical protein
VGSEFALQMGSFGWCELNVAEYFRWWVVDQITGRRELTDHRLSREDAQRRFPGAVPDWRSREFREEELFADSLPPE